MCLPGICRKCTNSCLNTSIVSNSHRPRLFQMMLQLQWAQNRHWNHWGQYLYIKSCSSSEGSDVQVEQFNLLYGEESEYEMEEESSSDLLCI